MLDSIDGVLKDAAECLEALDGLVIGLGPGSFTGLRVGLATVKGLAYARDLPIWGVPTTAALIDSQPGMRVVAVIDAHRDEVFAAGDGIEGHICCAPEALAARLKATPSPLLLVGSGAIRHAQVFRNACVRLIVPTLQALHAPRASLLVSRVDPDSPTVLATLEPLYVRRSDAEINYPEGFPTATAVPPQAIRRNRD